VLCLTRKKEERIVIDGDIELIIRHVRDGAVSLGFEAPRHRSIVRKELLLDRSAGKDCEGKP